MVEVVGVQRHVAASNVCMEYKDLIVLNAKETKTLAFKLDQNIHT